ncbi:hypothetical protein LINPERHAP1_LOCUS5988 [Linum perenne]
MFIERQTTRQTI